MTEWFKDRRQEFIAATLRQFGQIRRADLVRQFGITAQVASADIASFMANDPPVVYDVSAKTYVVTEPNQLCQTCFGTGHEAPNSICRDCDT